ncbi:hypothetical protein CN469_04370 [Bacillus cereus]|nr:hypothetical protein CN469_04370 [Bacillus cereus]
MFIHKTKRREYSRLFILIIQIRRKTKGTGDNLVYTITYFWLYIPSCFLSVGLAKKTHKPKKVPQGQYQKEKAIAFR